MSTVSAFQDRRAFLFKLLYLAGTALTVFGAKIIVIKYFGSVVPLWDQWDAEARTLYIPYLTNELQFWQLFSAHNEHRVILTRIISLILIEFGAEWDTILQMIVNSVIHAGFAVLLVSLVTRPLCPGQRLSVAIMTALLFALPLGWENTLGAFHSQVYLVVLFSVLAVWLLAASPAFSIGWSLGLLSCLLAVGSMASGALSFLAASAVIILQALVGQRRGTKEVIGVVIIVLLGVALVLQTPTVPGHAFLRADSVGEFISALVILMKWPVVSDYGLLLVNLPLVWLAVFCLLKSEPRASPIWPLVGVGIWLALQMLALAYGRGGHPLAARYLDWLLIGLPLNFGALLLMTQYLGRPQLTVAFSAIWLAFVAVGIAHHIERSTIPDILTRAEQSVNQTENVENYLRAGDAKYLNKKPGLEIPYPSAKRLKALLDDPWIKSILPQKISAERPNRQSVKKQLWLHGRFHETIVSAKKMLLDNGGGLLLALGIASFFLCVVFGIRGPISQFDPNC